jgi:hypothetical protein
MSEGYPNYPDTNRIIAERAEVLALVDMPDLAEQLKALDYDWAANTLNPETPIVALLDRHGFLEHRPGALGLNQLGVLLLARLLLQFDTSKDGDQAFGALAEKYEDMQVMSAGRNSIVVEGRHQLLGTRFVLKLVRPGASTNMLESVRLLARLDPESAIVAPVDFLTTRVRDAVGKPVELQCLVFPFVEGVTFRQFLSQRLNHLNSQVVVAFARQVGRALAQLESLDAYHGDLHEDNIIVDQFGKTGLRFRIVDISFDAMGSLPYEVCRNNDLLNFKQHIWRLLSAQRSSIPNVSLRKYIGTPNYLRIMEIMSDRVSSFAGVCSTLDSDAGYGAFLDEKARFLTAHFQTPVSFRLQRYEELTDPAMAVRLFVPLEQLMEKIRDFANIYVSGNRGSGKSTYLASLAFFPGAESDVVHVAETFGIYFPCRQGEFRPLGTRDDWSLEHDRRVVTNLIVTKIVRRTLEIIAAGVSAKRLRGASSLAHLREFVSEFVPPPGIVSIDPSIQSELDNLVSTMVRVEMDEVAALPNGKTPPVDHDARTLIRFLSIVRETFPDLARTRFQLLFDDAGSPYLPRNVQRVVNDLTLSSNPLFCVKLSAEKLTFDFVSSEGKVLEEGQDYLERDISHILFIGSGSGGLRREDLEQYFRRIVEQRLEYFKYSSSSITDYLGDEQISIDKLLQLLAIGRKNAYYCGWTTVWNIADRTPRNLLEIVSEIFAVAGIEPQDAARVVAQRDQDRAIKTISEKRLESLSQIPGAITVRSEQMSLGRRLFEVTSAIGSTFRLYLRAERGGKRKRQHLAIERNDIGELTAEAETVLRRLITFGVLDATKVAYARDDNFKKPLYVLNRIYCPAFNIGYRRDEHLRLSKGRLEQLLLTPEQFIKDGTKRLRSESHEEAPDLFRYKELF